MPPYEITGSIACDMVGIGKDMGPIKIGGAFYFPAITQWNGAADQDPGALPIGLPSSMGMFKSVDQGLTWVQVGGNVSMVSLNVADFAPPFVFESRSFCAVRDTPNNRLVVAYYGAALSPTDATLSIAFFDFGTDTWSTGFAPGPTFSMQSSGVTDTFGWHIVAAVDGLGNVVIGYETSNPSGLFVTRYLTTGAWDASTALPAGPTEFFGACEGSGLRTHAVLKNGGTGELNHYLLSNSLGLPGATFESISPNIMSTMVMVNPLINRGGGELVVVGLSNSAPGHVYVAAEAAVPTWTDLTPAALNDTTPSSAAYDAVNNTVIFTFPDVTFTVQQAVAYDGATFGAVYDIAAAAFGVTRLGAGSTLGAYITFTGLEGWSPYAFMPLSSPGTLPITGGAVIPSGATVLPGGKLTLIPQPIGNPPPTPPGGSPIWPPEWRTENAFDRCLASFRHRARGVCMEAESRCIVWHDMDELGRMPDGGIEFYERGSIITPAPAPLPTLITQFTVPSGYLGILYGILLHYTGTGFVDGSGDIAWRVKVGNGWASKGLGDCLFQLGTVGQCLNLTDYIAVNSGQTVQVLVQVPNLSGNIQVGASRILATLQGWYYPL
jgi:hypothetical protein